MKKFLSMLLVVLGVTLLSNTAANAQSQSVFSTVAGDTVSTSSSLDTVTKTLRVTAGYSALGIQVNATKVSGTITAKAYLYSSLDGVKYNLTDSATAFANTAGLQSVWFTKTGGLPYTYYQVQVRNVGTIASTEALAVKVYYVLRKFDN